MLEYRPFNQVSETIRTQIWNDGFSDYLRPIHMIKEQSHLVFKPEKLKFKPSTLGFVKV